MFKVNNKDTRTTPWDKTFFETSLLVLSHQKGPEWILLLNIFEETCTHSFFSSTISLIVLDLLLMKIFLATV